jgi:hypothetical protein
MAEATITASAMFPDLTDGATIPAVLHPHPMLVRVPHSKQARTFTLVANSTVGSTLVHLNVGTISTEITGYILINHTGQDLIVSLNSDMTETTIPDGGMLAYGTPVSASVPITAISVTTTATQVGNKYVECWLFGDP